MAQDVQWQCAYYMNNLLYTIVRRSSLMVLSREVPEDDALVTETRTEPKAVLVF